jgi:tetratricopeptide (TPR) repeat protein
VAPRGDDAATVEVCRREYERSRAPHTGALLANALRRRAPAEAGQLARSLLATEAQSDALYVLGKIAAAEDRHADADAALVAALELHRREARWSEVAKDLLALAEAATARKRFDEALSFLDECTRITAQNGDRALEGFCHLGSARVYASLGYRSGSQSELDLARQLTSRPVDQMWIRLLEGDDHQDAGDHAQAAVAYERALALALSLGQRRVEATAHMNLAYSLAHAGRDTKAEEHLHSAAALDPRHGESSDRWLIEAMIEQRRGQLARAADYATRAVRLAEKESVAENELSTTAPPTSEELAEAEALAAQLALSQGQLASAEEWARRAIGHVELLWVRQPLLQLRSWVAFRHRAPHETLFASLARRGRPAEALATFDAWMALSTFDTLGTAAPSLVTAAAPAPRGAQLQHLNALLHSPPPRPGARHRGERVDAPLLALVLAHGELWQLEVRGGVASLRLLGAFSTLKPRIDQLVSSPGDHAVADALGALVLSPGLAAATPEPLYIVLDPALAYLPMAALRWRGVPLGALRPLVRTLRPANLTCWRPTTSALPRRAAVLADSRGDLPGARREAEDVTRRLGDGTSLALGPAADRAAINSALSADFLHLAMHAEIDELGGKLVLADGHLSALELASTPRVPARVVLATCGSAMSPPGAYSLALGFLAAGAEQVLATLRRINDDDTAHITSRLYSTDLSDLAAALWRLQASAPADSEDLSSFVVFGEAACPAPSQPLSRSNLPARRSR